MGIRVHKFLGYGLSDLETSDGRITDSRVNTESPLLDCESCIAPATYLSWLEQTYPERSFPIERHAIDHGSASQFLDDCVVFEPESPVQALIVRPLVMSDWERGSNPIDWLEETFSLGAGAPQRDRLQLIDEPLYPYSNLMDKRSGEKLGPDAWHFAQLWMLNRRDNYEQGSTLLDLVVERSHFETVAEAEENLVPWVPEEIRDLARFGDLFADESAWLGLRPMLFTYWA